MQVKSCSIILPTKCQLNQTLMFNHQEMIILGHLKSYKTDRMIIVDFLDKVPLVISFNFILQAKQNLFSWKGVMIMRKIVLLNTQLNHTINGYIPVPCYFCVLPSFYTKKIYYYLNIFCLLPLNCILHGKNNFIRFYHF